MSQSRSTSALSWSRAFSAGAALASCASVSASIDRNATASGTKGLLRYGEFFTVCCLTVGLRCHARSPASVGGSQPAVRQAGLFVLVSEAYLTAPPTQRWYAGVGAEATHGLALRVPRGSCRMWATRTSKDGVNGGRRCRWSGERELLVIAMLYVNLARIFQRCYYC